LSVSGKRAEQADEHAQVANSERRFHCRVICPARRDCVAEDARIEVQRMVAHEDGFADAKIAPALDAHAEREPVMDDHEKQREVVDEKRSELERGGKIKHFHRAGVSAHFTIRPFHR